MQVWTMINNPNAYGITFGSEDSKFDDYLPAVENIIKCSL